MHRFFFCSALACIGLTLNCVGTRVLAQENISSSEQASEATPQLLPRLPVDDTSETPDDIFSDVEPTETLTRQPNDDLTNQPPAAAIDAAAEAEAAARATPSPNEQTTTARAPTRPAARQLSRRVQPALPTTITIRKIGFTESVYLDKSELLAITAPLHGKTIALTELNDVVASVNAIYADKHIALAEAILTRVDVAAGIVEIELFEAKLGSVVNKSKLASDRYIAYRLGLNRGDPADNRVINDRLTRLTLTNDTRVDASFSPGSERGFTDLQLDFVEPDPYYLGVTVDNYGKKSTGEERLLLNGVIRSLTGWYDPLAISLAKTERSFSGDLSYGRIVTPAGTKLTAALSYSTSETEPPVIVNSRARAASLGVEHPIILESNRRLYGTLLATAFDEIGDIGGFPVVDQKGMALEVGSSLLMTGERFVFAIAPGFRAVQWDDRVAREDSLDHYASTGVASLSARVIPNVVFNSQAVWQVAFNERAPSRYQLTTVGPYAVRGYDAGLQSGDSGFHIRNELEYNFSAPIGTNTLVLRPFIFADIGRAYTFFNGDNFAQDIVASAGAGLRFAFSKNLFGETFFAKPLRDANGFNVDGEWKARASLTFAISF